MKYLLERPIAVFMTFTALFLLGAVTYFTLPVSLLPDIAIPEITIQINGKNHSARELEHTTVKTFRNQLLQVGRLRDIRSEVRDGVAIIRLTFAYGTNTDLAFIEVNEKIDQAMSQLPRDMERPHVVKANTTDIPVFYVNMTSKNPGNKQSEDQYGFMQLSELAETIVKRRIEQLPEVVMADITGVVYYQLQLTPNPQIVKTANITPSDIENALLENNIEPGSMVVRDGFYEYNIKFASILRTPEDVQNIHLNKNGRIYRLGDITTVEVIAQRETGAALSNNKRTVTLAVIKQSEENMEKMKRSLTTTLDHFRKQYPDIEFNVTRNQTELLDYTINNLRQNLLLSFLFVLIIAFLFMGDLRSPMIIGGSMIVSIVISFIFFYLFHRSLNIISLAGLITALGMMIDNSIIVTENITRYRENGLSLGAACAKGTEEVITPMLSSSLTTIAVFLPLVFMSGIAGAIFFDQAFAITVGLMVSYGVGIIFLPICYKLLYKKINVNIENKKKPIGISFIPFDSWYEKGINYVFSLKKTTAIFFLLMFPICILMFTAIKKERMPAIDQQELLVRLDWNENIHLNENIQRVRKLLSTLDSSKVVEHSAFIGQQQFLLNREESLSTTEAEIYLKCVSTKELKKTEEALFRLFTQQYPSASFNFAPPPNLFERIFTTGEAELVAELFPRKREQIPLPDSIRALEQQINQQSGEHSVGVAFENQLNISIDHHKLLRYNVAYTDVLKLLRTAFKDNNVTTLRSYQQVLPITLAGKEQTINKLLSETLLQTQQGKGGTSYPVPLREFVSVTPSEELKCITAGSNGEYIPITFPKVKKADALQEYIQSSAQSQAIFDLSFSGALFTNEQMIRELCIILMISLLMMYFILASQFESFIQPLIVLTEIPIDIAGALIILYLCGHTLNLMSAIGIIVVCGIVVNDSILKIDVINQLRKEGVPLLQAIHEAGHRRLRAIIMTSLTTIFGMLPLLFTSDMGSELQRPLAIALIGAMFIGTLVSLFVVPLAYWAIYRNSSTNQQ